MFDTILESVRWKSLLVPAGFMFATLIIYFAFIKPFEKQAKRDLQRLHLKKERMDLIQGASQAATQCLLEVADGKAAASAISALNRVETLVAGSTEYPVLARAVSDLKNAMSHYQVALASADQNKLDSAVQRVTTACLAVSNETSSLIVEVASS